MKKNKVKCIVLSFVCVIVAELYLTLCDTMNCSMPGFPVLYLPEFDQTHAHWVDDTIQPFHPLSPPYPPAFNLSQQNELALCIRWPKYWSFSFGISPSKEYTGLISFRIDWFDLHAVQGTFRSLHQYHISKASVLWHLAFFMVQLSYPYMTTGKTTVFDRWTNSFC